MASEKIKAIEIVLAVFFIIVINLIYAQAQSTSNLPLQPGTMEAPPELYQNLPRADYLYPTADLNPWTQTAWREDYCNKTGMDFLVLIEPTACSPAVVRSDLLEEQDVPVLCRMTGVKINPLIQVPYIKSIVPVVENKSNEIAFINFLPARVALSYVPTSSQIQQKTAAGLEGLPTMNNLGYLWIQLKQQPVEAKMPDAVKANMTVRITYDVARTYGVAENQLVLPLLSQDDWMTRYKEFSFWRGKGYLRLQEITGTNRAKVAVYTNPRSAPLKVVELREGVEPDLKDEIMLPGFYCGAGLRLKLERLTTPTTRARLLVNGNELLLEPNEPILDSGCWINKIVSSASYGGRVTIFCPGGTVGGVDLAIKDYEANVEITDSEGKKNFAVTVGSEITVNKNGEPKRIYVGFIGKEYSQKGFDDFIIFFYRDKFSVIDDKDVAKIVSGIHEYVKSKRGATLDVKDMPEALWISELKSLFEGKNYARNLNFFVRKAKADEALQELQFSFSILSVTGPEQVYYKKDVEAAYKDAIEQWRNIAFAYSSKASPEGMYYGILALRNAANLARDLHKRLDQAELLKELIDKYATSEESEIINEVESAREELRRAIAGGGERITELSRPNGNYRIELISVEKPGLGTKEAHVELNGTRATLTVDDSVEGWVVVDIDENSIKLRNASDIEKTIAVGSWSYCGQTKLQLLNTVLKREAKVIVLPFEKTRTTETNFTVQIGIEKRAIKLSPEKTNELISKLNKTIASLESVRDKLGKIVTVWKKACVAGATTLWVKNFVTGLSGGAYARKLVMEPWSERCANPDYRQKIKANSVSDCYRIKEQNINQDIAIVRSSLSKTNKFISDVKAKEGVVSKSGLLGLSQTVNNDKFMQEVERNFPKELKDITLYEEKELKRIVDGDGELEFNGKRYKNITDLKNQNKGVDLSLTAKILGKKIDSKDIANSITELYGKGRLFRDDIKEIVLDLDLYKQCSKMSPAEITASALCSSVIKGSYGKLNYISEQVKESDTLSAFANIFGFNPTVARPKEVQSLKAEVRVADNNFINKFNFGPYSAIVSGERYSVISYPGTYYIAVVETAGNRKFTVKRLYEVSKLPSSATDKVTIDNMSEGSALTDKLIKIQIPDIEEVDPTLCNNNEIKQGQAPGESSATIKFWESGAYQGFVAWMPLSLRDGWYFATTSYTGLERAMIAWKENADINTFWICNVGLDGVPNFDYSTGGKGDDCCTLVSLVTGTIPEISGCLTPGCSAELVNRAKKCSAEAIKEFAAGNRKIKTSCGNFNLGKPPVARPAAQCEDYMSPTDCRIMYNLCDPVMCPASRCDFGGRMPVENVVQSGVIGSIMLCWPNFEGGKGVLVPVCLTGVHAGLDSFVGILKSSRDCLQEQLNSGKTVGICDQIRSIYMCEFFWRQIDPFLKAGLPSLAESLTTRGGGEYALFSESWKQSLDAARYFTDFYALQSFKAFKARSTAQVGTEICKKYASIVYPTQAKFWEELSKPESYPQATAWFSEVPMGGASPNSHYKVFFYVWAGRDQGVYYSVYFRRAAQPGYYEVPEEYLVKDGFGYVSAGQYVSMSPDFTAPSGYKEICIRLNDKEWCGFSQVSTDFAINEIQNYYLKNQLMQTVTTAKECISGTPTIIPTATLNIQSYVESSLEPQIYKRGIIRICSSRNPGESVQQTDRYKRIGYCDNKDIGCWLDMESVNQSVSDLKIRKEIVKEAEFRDITDAINMLGLNTPEASRIELENVEPKIIAVENKVNDFTNSIGKMNLEELEKPETHDKFKKEIERIDKEIRPLISDVKKISEKCARSDEKARAEFNIAKLYDLRARLYATPEKYEVEKKQEALKKELEERTCKDLGGTWKDECEQNEKDVTKQVGEKEKGLLENANKKCCVPLPKKKELDYWPISDMNNFNILDTPSESHCYGYYKTIEADLYNRENVKQKPDSVLMTLSKQSPVVAIAGGKVALIKQYDFGLLGNYTSIIINHSGEFYSRYYGKLSLRVGPFGQVEEGQEIATAEPGALSFWIYNSTQNPVANKDAYGSNPFCYFNDAILTSIYNKGSCRKNIEECRKLKRFMPEGPFIQWPLGVRSFKLGSKGCYGYRTLDNKKDFHDGIDIVADEGTAVFAVADGKVYEVYDQCQKCNWNTKTNCRCNGGYGNMVVIKHSETLYTSYLHLENVNVKKDDEIQRGTKIGTVGSTGYSSGPHLDFKVYTSSEDVLFSDKGKHPLCFFTSEIRSNIVIPYEAVEDSKKYEENHQYGYCNPTPSTCQEALREAGIKFKLELEPKCDDYSEAQCKEKTGSCWWNSQLNKGKGKCLKCPNKCEGNDFWFVGNWLGIDDLVFRTSTDCEQNNCNLQCLWVKGKCQSVTIESVQAKVYESLTLEELTRFKEIVQNSLLDSTIKKNVINEIDKALAKYAPQEVFIVSKIEKSQKEFTAANKIVENKDSVTICAVVKIGNVFYSKESFEFVDIDGKRNTSSKYSGSPQFRWYNIVPKYLPNYQGWKKNIYELPPFVNGAKDLLQYDQVSIENDNNWCIEAKDDVGTYWYRVEISFDKENTWHSSLGKAATALDKGKYEGKYEQDGINFDKYNNYWETLLEPAATENFGISSKVHRISRKSDYAEKTCKDLDYNPTSLRCKFISTLEAYKNVPFALGCSSYSCYPGTEASGADCPIIMVHAVQSFISLDCLNLMVGALNKTTGKSYPFNNFEQFIKEHTTITLGKDDQGNAKPVSFDKIIPTNNLLTFGKNKNVEVGDILFMSTDRGFTHTFIIYNDSGSKPSFFDEDDIVVYASQWCPGTGRDQKEATNKRPYDGKLCYAPIGRYNKENLKFILVKIKDLQ